jgi:hypothetical protein
VVAGWTPVSGPADAAVDSVALFVQRGDLNEIGSERMAAWICDVPREFGRLASRSASPESM